VKTRAAKSSKPTADEKFGDNVVLDDFATSSRRTGLTSAPAARANPLLNCAHEYSRFGTIGVGTNVFGYTDRARLGPSQRRRHH
jgi:hypothetical protein